MKSLKDNNWKQEVIYQIYPRSYYSKKGNSVGDIAGIAAKIEYINKLGIDRVWLSPFFDSPMKDYGYDVKDYYKVDKMFGTNQDFYALVKAVHKKGLKIIIDQVYNHTSDQCKWFNESANRQDKKDWYIWADANKDGSPPNNWLSIFGGGAWQWHPTRMQYYLHQFLKEQPDLNFNNPKVIKEILNVAKFWLDKGVDGFRLDTAHCYTQDKKLRNNPPRKDAPPDANPVNPYFMQNHIYDIDYKRNIPFFEKLRKLTDKYPSSFVVGEVGGNQQLDSMCLYTKTGKRLHAVYIFCFLTEFSAKDLYGVFNYLAKNMDDGFPCWAFSNHDVKRVASRGNVPSKWMPEYTRFMMALLLSIRGVPCIYQGEELGLPEADIAYEDLQDPYGKEFWPEYKGRDGCRTPMPWDANHQYGGFSKKKPWLPIPKQHLKLAVNRQEKDKKSMLWFTRTMLEWRKKQDAILDGEMTLIKTQSKDVFAFYRESNQQKILFMFNYSPKEQSISLPINADNKRLIPDSFFNRVKESGGTIKMPPYGVYITQVN